MVETTWSCVVGDASATLEIECCSVVAGGSTTLETPGSPCCRTTGLRVNTRMLL